MTGRVLFARPRESFACIKLPMKCDCTFSHCLRLIGARVAACLMRAAYIQHIFTLGKRFLQQKIRRIIIQKLRPQVNGYTRARGNGVEAAHSH